MAMWLHDFCKWLSETPLSLTIQNVSWIIPTVQSIHILSVAIVFFSAMAVDLRLLGVIGRSAPASAYGARFLPWIWPTLVILLLTGATLIIAEPARSLQNAAFQAKMIMLILAIGATVTLQRPLAADAAYWDSTEGRKTAARVIAVVSICLWVGIVFAGRWIAYMNTAGD